MPRESIVNKYNQFKTEIKNNSALSSNATIILKDLFSLTYQYVSNCRKLELISNIANKQYFSFKNNIKFSRPVNQELFLENDDLITDFWVNLNDGQINRQTPGEITKVCYTIAMSFCCSIDLLKNNDQKTPGTYYEYFISHLLAKQLCVVPKKEIEVLNLDMNTKLPTDLIFDLGQGKHKLHVPVKTSTRERVVQVWSHQRILDGVYGTGRFIGLLTCIGETKLDHSSLEVTEICLPDQWKLYQLFIAKLHRMYYLDVPTRYAAIDDEWLQVKAFGEFFHENTIF